MSNLMSMMYTGVSGIFASQVGIDVTGQNITNMKTPGYSKQIVNLTTMPPQSMGKWILGKGVQVSSITRSTDALLTKTVNSEQTSYSFFQSMQTTVKESMLYFNELEAGSGLGDALKNYFAAWQSLASTAPDKTDEAEVKRYSLIEKTQTLSTKIREGYASIEDVRSKADTTIQTEVTNINNMIQSIAELNKSIVSSEAGGANANDLRDTRDLLISQLSQKANITTHEKANGEMIVYMGTQSIVDGANGFQLQALPNPANANHLDVFFTTGAFGDEPRNITSTITGGTIGAQIKSRDELLPKYLTELDSLAKSLISETNKLHVTGQGLTRFTSVGGTNGVENPLSMFTGVAGNLAYPIKNGSFSIDVYDATGKVVKSINVPINPDTDNMTSVIDKINSLSGGTLTASLNDNNSLQFSVAPDMTFAFTEDTSDFLMASGINTFFSGAGAKDIDISGFISKNPNYIATGKTGAPGDNTNAKLLAEMQQKSVTSANGKSVTIGEFYGYFIGVMGSDKSQIDVFTATKKMSYTQVSMRLESIRGVSESEELVTMSIFQRSFEANSRFINTVDEMLNTIVNGLGAGR